MDKFLEIESSLSSWYREGDTRTIESSFLNVNVSSTQFPELLLCLLFLKNNQLKKIIMLEKYILEQQILLSYKSRKYIIEVIFEQTSKGGEGVNYADMQKKKI